MAFIYQFVAFELLTVYKFWFRLIVVPIHYYIYYGFVSTLILHMAFRHSSVCPQFHPTVRG